MPREKRDPFGASFGTSEVSEPSATEQPQNVKLLVGEGAAVSGLVCCTPGQRVNKCLSRHSVIPVACCEPVSVHLQVCDNVIAKNQHYLTGAVWWVIVCFGDCQWPHRRSYSAPVLLRKLVEVKNNFPTQLSSSGFVLFGPKRCANGGRG